MMFKQALAQLQQENLLRTLHNSDSAQDAQVTINGKTVILFASNNYLGLANHPKIKEAAITAIKTYGFGTGASRLLSGSITPHKQLEEQLASFTKTASALIFNSGYHANLGLIQTLAQGLQPHGIIFVDRSSHASLIDAIRLTKTPFRVYRRKNTNEFKHLFTNQNPDAPQKILIITEGVFSMDGDLAPLPELLTSSKNFKTTFLVDDAHGFGVLGNTGRGTIEHFGLDTEIPIRMGTLGKAIGSIGAFVAGPHDLTQALINRARSFMYTTALPPAAAAAASAALKIIESEPERRRQLWKNRDYMLKNIQALGFNTLNTESPILPILVGEPLHALRFSEALFERGVYAPAIRPPTIPRGTSRLRMNIMATHDKPQLDYTLDVLHNTGKLLGIIS